jgi:ribosomal-protein-alanine N-acetyltransferase
MTTLQTHSAAAARVSVRPAVPADREQISNLMFFETHVHRHLDWRAPLDWLGRSPYWVLEDGARIAAALACPIDPDSIAWIRLFAFASQMSGRAVWRRLWEAARQDLAEAGGATAAAIAAQDWIAPILMEAGFELVDDIVVLAWDPGPHPAAALPPGVATRAMSSVDLPAVAEVDAEAFDRLWCNSLEALTRALAQASYASVAEDGSGVLGYQLSTGSPLGTHLARLAVRPAAQRRGLGAALVGDLIAHLPASSEPRLTVNTQSKNASSLALYERLRFRLTGEHYPVYTLGIQGSGGALPQQDD